MLRRHLMSAALALIVSLFVVTESYADDYKLDTAHSSVVFNISHAGLSKTYGMFTQGGGSFSLDGSNSKFELSIKADSINTGNAKRDAHLKSPDFFNVKQFPEITLNSTAVKVDGDKYHVTADVTMLGKTKPVEFVLTQMGEKDNKTGFDTTFTINRSDWGLSYGLGMIGDEVTLMISFEGEKK